jgi:YgiT-type zinc finger domain-containing protein
MKCVVCKLGETRPGFTTVTLERDAAALVVRKVPAQICDNCGEAYVSAEVTRTLLQSAREALRAGVEVEHPRIRPHSRLGNRRSQTLDGFTLLFLLNTDH